MSKRVRRTRKGEFEIRLPTEERELLRGLPGQLREALDEADPASDPAVARLFPSAYPDDDERDREFRRLMQDELTTGRLEALAALENGADAERLDEAQVMAWARAINDIRLFLGTRLDVSEDDASRNVPDDDPRAPGLAVYHYLSWLQEQIVDALAR